MSMNGEIKITLVGGAPYGIRIKGGAEFGVPISIENVTSNSKAANGGVKTGDVIIAINGVDVTRATHDKTKSLVSQAKDILQLTLKRGSPILSTEPAPTVNPSSAPTIIPVKQTPSKYTAPASPSPSAPISIKQEPTPVSKPQSFTTSNISGSAPQNTEAPTTNVVVVGRTGVGNFVSSRDNVKFTAYNPDDDSANRIGATVGACEECKENVKSKHIKLDHRVWHPEHFNCTKCSKNLQSLGFFEEQQKIMCKECYAEIYAPKCYACGRPCAEVRCIFNF
ncbi:hypothetical protein HZS_6299 [Henneguya salminicola]|nr:hypothetical protein HZS_6299 [Henneguya salminicola]